MAIKQTQLQCPDSGVGVILSWSGSWEDDEPGLLTARVDDDDEIWEEADNEARDDTRAWVKRVNENFGSALERFSEVERRLVKVFGCEPDDLDSLCW
jgi:hypothetical protein